MSTTTSLSEPSLAIKSDLPAAERMDNRRALRAKGQFPSTIGKVQKMLAKVTTQWRVPSGGGKRGSKRGGRPPQRGSLAARLHAPPMSSPSQQSQRLKRGEMGKLVQEIHAMVRKLHQETEKEKLANKRQSSKSIFSDPGNKASSANNSLNKRGLQPEYHDPVEEKIDEILAMIRWRLDDTLNALKTRKYCTNHSRVALTQVQGKAEVRRRLWNDNGPTLLAVVTH